MELQSYLDKIANKPMPWASRRVSLWGIGGAKQIWPGCAQANPILPRREAKLTR